MNDNQARENVENKVEEINEQIDPRNVEAEVIGVLRKDKIGKPILVLEIAGLFALVFIALPIVYEQLNDPNSFLSIMINGSAPIVNVPNNDTSEFTDGGTQQPLNSTTKMKKENIVMENFVVSGSSIKCNMYSYNGVINLDEKEYYLEIYSSSNNLLAAIKLTGTYASEVTPVDLAISGLNFNSGYKYLGKIVEMNTDLYPNVEIPMDESGIGSFTCTLNNQREITYTFKNYYLIKIDDKEMIYLEDYAGQDYLNKKKEYEDKQVALGEIAVVEENDFGFAFKASIDWEVEEFSLPDGIVDYNYYKSETLAKEINYALKGKGYDCK